MISSKTAEPIEMPFGLWTQLGARNHVLDPPCEWAIIRGKDMPGHAQRHCAMSCAKMAEPIDLPFGLCTWWAEGSTSPIVFARWCKCSLMGGHIGSIWRIRLNHPSASEMWPYVKLLWPFVKYVT